MSFVTVERYLDKETAKRDPTPLQDAFGHFSELLIRFPDSPYTADARARMVFIRERLASHEVEIARYYMKRHAYMAAANRCTDVLLHYQKTGAVADAVAVAPEELAHEDHEQQVRDAELEQVHEELVAVEVRRVVWRRRAWFQRGQR